MNTDIKQFVIADAYWISPNGEIFQVKLKHINFIRDNLGLFNFTEADYISTYLKYGEKFGFEGKARAEIMLNAMKNGWIRLRNSGNQGWTIEVWEFDENTKKSIAKWSIAIARQIKQSILNDMNLYTQIKIHILQQIQGGINQDKYIIKTKLFELIVIED